MNKRGFTLIEVMVSLILLGLVGAMLMELFSINLNSSKKTSEYTDVLLLASSLMDEALSMKDPVDASTSGEWKGYRFHREVHGIEVDSENIKKYEIVVTIDWSGSKRYELRSHKIVRRDEE